MKLRNYISVFLLLTSSFCFSQTIFKNIDTLLFKVFESVNLNDSSKYIKVVNQKALFLEKKVFTQKDSLTVLKPYYESYTNFRESISDMVTSNEFTISYVEFSNPLKKSVEATANGKVLLHVKLAVNETFVVTVPFMLTIKDGFYFTEDPLKALFLEN